MYWLGKSIFLNNFREQKLLLVFILNFLIIPFAHEQKLVENTYGMKMFGAHSLNSSFKSSV